MLLILFYWFYLFLLTSSYGIVLKKILKLKTASPFIIIILGSFLITLLATCFAVFYKLDSIFESILATTAVVFIVVFKSESRAYFKEIKALFSSLSILLKVLFIVVFVLALAQSASAPYLIDNESYYIHSIKWLDQYGIVPGLSNLHFF